MAAEEDVAQLDGPAAIVLGQLVLVELEGCRQPLLHLAGERHSPVLPVDGNKLGEFVRTLDDASERLGNQSPVRLVPRHLAHKRQWGVTQLHLLAGLDRERRHSLRGDLRHQLRDVACDLDSVLVELALP
jgi:hypothetical protein